MAKDEDSSSSEDFEAKLREAVDPTLFTNSMFAADGNDVKKAQARVPAKSNRKVEEPAASKEDIEVTPSMQNYVAKKLASIIDDQVQFVEPRLETADQKVDDDDDAVGIRLFSNSVAPVTVLNTEEASVPSSQPTKKKKNKKQKSARDPSPDQATKLSEAAVDASFILDQIEVKRWHKNTTRLEKNVDHYNLRNGNLFPVEPINEFTKLKRKNNWDPKKISQPIKRTLATE